MSRDLRAWKKEGVSNEEARRRHHKRERDAGRVLQERSRSWHPDSMFEVLPSGPEDDKLFERYLAALKLEAEASLLKTE